MQDKYYWELSQITTLKNSTNTAHSSLKKSLEYVTTLIDSMEAESTWAGEHKKMFIAWMRMLSQIHTQLAADTIGGVALEAMTNLETGMTDFETQSAMKNLNIS